MKKLILILCSTILFGCDSQDFKAEQPRSSSVQQEQLESAKKVVENFIPDSELFEFRNQSGNCGEVNYMLTPNKESGYKRFIVVDKNIALIEGWVEQNTFELSWKATCEKRWN